MLLSEITIAMYQQSSNEASQDDLSYQRSSTHLAVVLFVLNQLCHPEVRKHSQCMYLFYTENVKD